VSALQSCNILYDGSDEGHHNMRRRNNNKRSVFDVVGQYRLGAAGARATNITAIASGVHGIWHYYYITTLCCVLVPLYKYIYMCIILFRVICHSPSSPTIWVASVCERASMCERHVRRRRRLRSYCSY